MKAEEKTLELEIPITGGSCPPTNAYHNQSVYWRNHDSQTATLTFPNGWPFNGTAEAIQVQGGHDSETYIISSSAAFATYPYSVSEGASQKEKAYPRPLDNPTIKVEPGLGK